MKKTNKENPLTTFRKLNQARQGMVMKSLKKAQAGIQTNGNPEDMMINKPGSTGGYKAPTVTDKYQNSLNDYLKSGMSFGDANKAAYKTNVITPASNTQLENYGISPYKNKKGGSIGRKK